MACQDRWYSLHSVMLRFGRRLMQKDSPNKFSMVLKLIDELREMCDTLACAGDCQTCPVAKLLKRLATIGDCMAESAASSPRRPPLLYVVQGAPID